MNEPDIGYLVMEYDLEWNGETYYPTGSDPVKFYWDKDKALEKVKTATAAKIQDINIINFGYDITDVSSMRTSEIQKELTKLGLDWDGCFDELWIPKMSLEKRLKLIDIFDRIGMYYVEEVEVEE
jgi:hypothetical protein